MKRLIGVILIVAGAGTAPAAAADRMVGKCSDGRNLCAADPATGTVTPITSDGATTSYRFAEVSTDGSVLGFVKNGVPSRGGPDPATAQPIFDPEQDVQSFSLSPDGQGASFRTSGTTGGTFVSRLYVTAPDHAPWFEESSSYVQDTGWLGREALNSSPNRDDSICVYRQGMSCVRTVGTIPGATIVSGPVGSPDGSRFVVAAGSGEPTTYRLVLVDPATAAPIRDLDTGPDPSAPSWSPDGTTVSFTRGGDTWAVPADGSAPPRMIVAGFTSAAWGRDPTPPPPPPKPNPTPAPTPPAGGGTSAVGTSTLRTRSVRASRTGRLRLALRCEASAGCRAQRWTLTRRGKRLATVTVPALAASASRTVTVKLSASGRRTLRRARSKRLAVRVNRPGGSALTLTLRR